MKKARIVIQMAGRDVAENWKRQEKTYEDDVSAEEAAKKKGAWVSQKDEDQKRSGRPEKQKAKRKKAPFRISGRGVVLRNGASAADPQVQAGF